ncbi:MAG: branched-chain amino acid ABC transporter permease [Thermodesulfobacteriota bacterium]
MEILLLNALANGILLGGVLALLAFGLNLIFGVVKVIHMAYGQCVMLGMYIIYILRSAYDVPFVVASGVAVAAMAVWGALLHVLVIRPLLGVERLNQLLALAGLIIVFENLAHVIWGADLRGVRVDLPVVSLGNVFLKTSNLVAFLGALVVLGILYFVLQRTYVGLAIRAIAQDTECARLMGIDPSRIYLLTLTIGGALTGLIAAFFSPIYSVHPHFGGSFTLMAFIIVVLGGMGNLAGGFLGAFIIGIVTSVAAVLTSTEVAEILALVIFILVVLVRPQGLLGARGAR